MRGRRTCLEQEKHNFRAGLARLNTSGLVARYLACSYYVGPSPPSIIVIIIVICDWAFSGIYSDSQKGSESEVWIRRLRGSSPVWWLTAEITDPEEKIKTWFVVLFIILQRHDNPDYCISDHCYLCYSFSWYWLREYLLIRYRVSFTFQALICDKGYRVSSIKRAKTAYSVLGSLTVECEQIALGESTNCAPQQSVPKCTGLLEGLFNLLSGKDSLVSRMHWKHMARRIPCLLAREHHSGSCVSAPFHWNTCLLASSLDPVCCSSPSVQIDSASCINDQLNTGTRDFSHSIVADLVSHLHHSAIIISSGVPRMAVLASVRSEENFGGSPLEDRDLSIYLFWFSSYNSEK